ncbi:MAG TPA: 2TM domain-containing protein [Chloroflexia bacterium]|nr:2TM domain-containing protein [Chloroflexia bacterium]
MSQYDYDYNKPGVSYNNANSNDNAQYYESYRQAEKRVKAKVAFYWHGANYIIINGLLIVIYLFTCLPVGHFYYPWFIWPLLTWGVGLIFHFLSVFVFPGHSQYDRQQMIEAEMRRMGASPASSPYPGQAQGSGYSRFSDVPPDQK